jgi:signal transduction histidine kinase
VTGAAGGRRIVVGDRDRAPQLDELLEALSLASVGRDVRLAVDPARDEPLAVVGAALNILLEDLAFRQREREDALHQVAVAEAKQEFLAYLSHDMQTPLALLLGALQLLGERATPEEIAASVPLMRRAAETLQRLVLQFLDLARLDADRPLELTTERMDLRPAVRAAVERFEDRGEIPVEAPPRLPPVDGDPDRVEQVVTNLLSNAFKYARDPAITVDVDAERVHVTIADRGDGLSETDLQHAFGRYARGRVSQRAAGTGLGLYISRALAEAMGGTLTGASAPGDGSRFTLSLRRSDAAVPADRGRSGDAESSTTSSRPGPV